jgi:hypothetical protein
MGSHDGSLEYPRAERHWQQTVAVKVDNCRNPHCVAADPRNKSLKAHYFLLE